MRSCQRTQRGNALIEFALTFVLLFGVFSGSFEFGYSFYAYNTLITLVREGARYASLRPYDSATSTPTASFRTAVQNMVVYGNPAGGTSPLLRGLVTSNVQVDVLMSGSAPTQTTVSISGFTLDALFGTFNLNGKPSVSFPYLGIPTPP